MGFYDGKLIKKLTERRLHIRNQGEKLLLRIAESAAFLKRFVKQPRQVGSIIPSSPFLTRAVMSKIKWDDARYVAELGAGTGVFTRAIVRNLQPSGKLLVFEIDPAFKAMIENEHPDLTIYGDATELHRIIDDLGIDQLDYVVSSLPFTVMPPRVMVSILNAVGKCLKPGGKFIAYQYSRQKKHYFDKRFENVSTSFVWCNVPPAFVFECTKAEKGQKKERKKGCVKN